MKKKLYYLPVLVCATCNTGLLSNTLKTKLTIINEKINDEKIITIDKTTNIDLDKTYHPHYDLLQKQRYYGTHKTYYGDNVDTYFISYYYVPEVNKKNRIVNNLKKAFLSPSTNKHPIIIKKYC